MSKIQLHVHIPADSLRGISHTPYTSHVFLKIKFFIIELLNLEKFQSTGFEVVCIATEVKGEFDRLRPTIVTGRKSVACKRPVGESLRERLRQGDLLGLFSRGSGAAATAAAGGEEKESGGEERKAQRVAKHGRW